MNVPRLRFKGFEGEWISNKLGSITELTDGTHYTPEYKKNGIPFWSVETITVNAKPKFISREAHYENIKRCKPEFNDILVTRISSGINSLGMPKLVDWNEEFSIYVSVGLIKSSSKFHSGFLSHYISSPFYKKEFRSKSLLTATPKKINMIDFKNTKVILPNLKEQERIDAFLTLITKKIQKQQEKIEKLEQFKKGMMQKIFSQELRFKDEDGGEFPEWKEKKLSELGEFKKSYSFSRSYEGVGEYVHIHYGDIHTKLNSLIENETDLPSINVEGVLEELEVGDVLFADASEDYKDLGKAVVIHEKENKKMVAGLHTHRFQPLSLINPVFLMYYTKTDYYSAFIRMYGTGVSVLGISKSNLGALEVPVPSIEEQVEIAKFLINMERKIKKEKEKLLVLAEQKSGLMYEVFI